MPPGKAGDTVETAACAWAQQGWGVSTSGVLVDERSPAEAVDTGAAAVPSSVTADSWQAWRTSGAHSAAHADTTIGVAVMTMTTSTPAARRIQPMTAV